MVPFLMSWNLLMCNRHSHIISIKWPFFSINFFPYIFEHHCLKMKYLICLNMYLILYLHVYLVFIFLFVTDAISPSLSDVIYAYVCDFICVSICYYIGQCILCIWCYNMSLIPMQKYSVSGDGWTVHILGDVNRSWNRSWLSLLCYVIHLLNETLCTQICLQGLSCTRCLFWGICHDWTLFSPWITWNNEATLRYHSTKFT